MSTVIAGRPARSLPKFGGFSLGMIRLEMRRLLRNKRTIFFSIIMPSVFFLIFGTNNSSKTQSAGHGNVTAYILISLAVYAAMLATTSGGAQVSVERAAGWSRQLRLTPLKPIAYIGIKLTLAMFIGACAVALITIVGALFGAKMPAYAWVSCILLAWICALVFAAFGLFMGYLLPSENVMQILAPVLAVLSFAGGLFVPLNLLGHVFETIAKFTPAYGVGELARYPLTRDGDLWVAIINVVVWTAVFSLGAMWRFRRDTARV